MIPEAAVEAAAKWMHDHDCRSALHSGFPPDFECYDWRDEARELLEAAAPHILNAAAHGLAGADKTSYWDDMYQKLEEQDGGDLSSESTAYLNGIADAMRFLQERATP